MERGSFFAPPSSSVLGVETKHAALQGGTGEVGVISSVKYALEMNGGARQLLSG